MPVVTSFESALINEERAEKVEEGFDYGQVVSALKNDRMVAENVFARCAKHHFRKLLGEKVRLHDPKEPMPSVLWVAGVSVVLPFNGKDLDHLKLEELVKSQAAALLKIQNEKEILLVESLNTKIHEVGPNVFSFSLKQKWGLNGQ